MKIREAVELLEAKIVSGGGEELEREIVSACASDMMSDALAYSTGGGLMLTGLLNPQAVRTAEMLDMHCICFVRGKIPGQDIVDLAEERGIVVLSTRHQMFSACGKLYQAGLTGGDDEL